MLTDATARGAESDKPVMIMDLMPVGLAFVVVILYIMRRRVRLGRRKASF
jgi:hypothetical protein